MIDHLWDYYWIYLLASLFLVWLLWPIMGRRILRYFGALLMVVVIIFGGWFLLFAFGFGGLAGAGAYLPIVLILFLISYAIFRFGRTGARKSGDQPAEEKPQLPGIPVWILVVLGMLLLVIVTTSITAGLSTDHGWQTYSSSTSELPIRNITALATDDQDQIWIGGYREKSFLGQFSRDGTWRAKLQSTELSEINALVFDQDGQLWVGDSEGFLGALNADGEWVYTSQHGKFERLRALAVDRNGQVWIGTGQGIFIRTKQDTYINYNQENSPLARDFIEGIAFDSEGTAWIAHGIGLQTLSENGEWRTVAEDTGSEDFRNITAIYIDLADRVWLAVDFFQPKLLMRDGTDKWFIISAKNSGLWDDDNYIINSLAMDTNNILWIGSSNGLQSYDLEGSSDLSNNDWWLDFRNYSVALLLSVILLTSIWWRMRAEQVAG